MKAKYCIIVSGSRHLNYNFRKPAPTKEERLRFAGIVTRCSQTILQTFMKHYDQRNTQVVVGDANGVDEFVRDFMDPDKVMVFSAAWREHSKKAGPYRNNQMLSYATQEHAKSILLAFPMRGRDNLGTFDCINQARRFEMDVVTTWLDNVI